MGYSSETVIWTTTTTALKLSRANVYGAIAELRNREEGEFHESIQLSEPSEQRLKRTFVI